MRKNEDMKEEMEKMSYANNYNSSPKKWVKHYSIFSIINHHQNFIEMDQLFDQNFTNSFDIMKLLRPKFVHLCFKSVEV